MTIYVPLLTELSRRLRRVRNSRAGQSSAAMPARRWGSGRSGAGFVPEGFPVLTFQSVAGEWTNGVAIGGQDAVALHFADPVGAEAEVGHVKAPGALGERLFA